MSHFAPHGKLSAVSMASRWNGKYAGREALTADDRGYRAGQIGRQKLFAHRVIWKLVHGTEPDEIDHINGDPSDNRPANLRDAGHAANCKNQRLSIRNRSGAHGVSWASREGKWKAERPGRQRGHIGYFDDLNAAVAARKAAERAAGYHPNHGRK